MNNNYPSCNIDDLARLARETCVYRGHSQGIPLLQTTTERHRKTTTGSRWVKLLSAFKRR